MGEPSDPSEPAIGRNRRRALGRTIGAIGEGMLTLGVLVGLFVVWEVWWTDIMGTRHQRDVVENLDWAVPPIPIPFDIGEPSATSSPEVSTPPVVPWELRERVEAPPIEHQPDRAETFATIYVPRWGKDYVRPVSEGVGRRDVLDPLGIGHYPETALPGGWGNFAVAGHRTTFGKPFERIEELLLGDIIVVRTESTWYVYRVTEAHVVKPSFDAAIAPVPGNGSATADGRYITLTTCHPRLSARQRYVVYGVLDYWAPASAGYPPEILDSAVGALDGATGYSEGAVG